jgi:hypothetical protein
VEAYIDTGTDDRSSGSGKKVHEASGFRRTMLESESTTSSHERMASPSGVRIISIG